MHQMNVVIKFQNKYNTVATGLSPTSLRARTISNAVNKENNNNSEFIMIHLDGFRDGCQKVIFTAAVKLREA